MRIYACKKFVGLKPHTALIIGIPIANLPICHLFLTKSVVTYMAYVSNISVSQPDVHVT